jgi:hypothetical protein
MNADGGRAGAAGGQASKPVFSLLQMVTILVVGLDGSRTAA